MARALAHGSRWLAADIYVAVTEPWPRDAAQINVEPNHTTLAGHDNCHDIWMASIAGFLGSVDSNTGDPLLGWDTDQFPMDVKNATLAMQIILKQGGLAPGGLNFDAKVRASVLLCARRVVGSRYPLVP